jgi:hypothetical protein
LSAIRKTERRAHALWFDMIMSMPYGIQQQQQIQLVVAVAEKDFLIAAVDI